MSLSVLLFGLCLLVSFLYAGIEAGLLSFSRTRLRSRVHRGEPGAVRLSKLLAHPGRLLATVLLVTNFADVVALVLITDACVRRLSLWGYVVAGVTMLPVYLVALQMLPKSLFRRFPSRATAALAGLLQGTSRLLWPVLTAGRVLLGRTLLPPMPAMEKGVRGVFVARQEFKSLSAEGERTGALTPAEHRTIDNVLDFSGVITEDVAQPLPEAFRCGRDGGTATPTVGDLRTFARRTPEVDYLPVVDPAGTLTALVEVFALQLERDAQRPAAAYLRRAPLFVTPTEPALHTLRRLRSLRLGAAVVRDADGRLRGIVRTGEVLQRLVREQSVLQPSPAVGSPRGGAAA